jgi:hypothetical protein
MAWIKWHVQEGYIDTSAADLRDFLFHEDRLQQLGLLNPTCRLKLREQRVRHGFDVNLLAQRIIFYFPF